MTELENKEILHEIELGRVQNGIVKKCLIELEKANRLIRSELRKTDGVYTKARYKELRAYLKEVAKELKKNLDLDISAEEFIDYELEAQIKLYKKYGKVQLVAPNKEQLYTTATFTPYTASSSFENYLDSFEYDYFNMWDSAIRTGYLTGQTTPQIVKRVMGYSARDSQVADMGQIHALRVSIERNTRTALQSFAMETHRMMYEKNDSLFKGYKWYATLDRRTCIVCGKLDGEVKKQYKDFGEVPPAHYNCRCVILPLVEGVEELEEDTTRASMNGQVDSTLTFEEWLKKQSTDVQEDVLGKTRYNMYKEGKSLGGFIQDNRILTIKELREED